jgi:two-component system phosphate regulon response regulator PhoB
MKRILSVEDNAELQILIEGALDDAQVVTAATLAQARRELERDADWSLILLDVELPDGDGIAFYASLKQDPRFKAVPVIVLTGKSEVAHKVLAFSLGVEDYITKPFDVLELRARVEARIRKAREGAGDDRVRVYDLVLSRAQQRVWLQCDHGHLEPVSLTSLEFRILSLFARHFDRIYSREMLLDEVWGHDVHVVDRTVDSHISHLRRKIAPSRLTIEAVAGEGYRLTQRKRSSPSVS